MPELSRLMVGKGIKRLGQVDVLKGSKPGEPPWSFSAIPVSCAPHIPGGFAEPHAPALATDQGT